MWKLQVAFLFSYDDPKLVVSRLHEMFPHYTFDETTVFGILNAFDWKFLYVTIHLCAPIFPCYAIIMYCRKRMLRILQRAASMSERTKRMHYSLLLVRLWSEIAQECLGSFCSNPCTDRIYFCGFFLLNRTVWNI